MMSSASSGAGRPGLDPKTVEPFERLPRFERIGLETIGESVAWVNLGEVNGAVRAAAWRMLLPNGDAGPVEEALRTHEARLGADVKVEVLHLLWRQTADSANLAATRHDLAVPRAHAPVDRPTQAPPLHRAIDEAP